jgi:flagellar biosynthesis/type III secretory pathway chaperone
MTTNLPDITGLVPDLAACLDEEISLLDRRRGQLEALSGAILDRDDGRMEALLGEIEQTMQEQRSVDLRLQAMRAALANALACRPEEVKLAALVERLQGRQRTDLDYRRQQIIVLTDRLRQQHLETCLFLLESSRINRLLLESLFPNSEPVVTYGTDGRDQWRPDTGLVDAEL